MRFDVYGRFVLVVERIDPALEPPAPGGAQTSAWRVLEVGVDGKRGLRHDLVIPEHLEDDQLAQYLDDLLHEQAQPGARVRRIDEGPAH